MKEKKVKISNKYSIEISSIAEILRGLKEKRIYELSGVKQDGYLTTNAIKLEELILDLLDKIEYDKNSKMDEIQKEMKKVRF